MTDLKRMALNYRGKLVFELALQRRTMGVQAGWSEPDLAAFWSVQQQVSEVAESREVVYRNTSNERVTQNTVNRRLGQVVHSNTTGQLRQCELSLFLRPGGKTLGPRLVDYQIRGESCNIDTLGKNRPKQGSDKSLGKHFKKTPLAQFVQNARRALSNPIDRIVQDNLETTYELSTRHRGRRYRPCIFGACIWRRSPIIDR